MLVIFNSKNYILYIPCSAAKVALVNKLAIFFPYIANLKGTQIKLTILKFFKILFENGEMIWSILYTILRHTYSPHLLLPNYEPDSSLESSIDWHWLYGRRRTSPSRAKVPRSSSLADSLEITIAPKEPWMEIVVFIKKDGSYRSSCEDR